jgi:LytS/YehU family sensor histidine kinase
MLYISWSFLYFWVRSFLLGLSARADADAAELRALRAHLNPRFLFNALNAIAAEADDNPKAVRALSLELAAYLRYSLAHREAETVPLGAELDAMDHYLKVEKLRFEERLAYTIETTPEARAARVPGFFLQPLVENAVKHGLAGNAGAMKLVIRAARSDTMVRIEVGNTGAWIERSRPGEAQGFGLESIRQRLQILFPGRHRFEIDRGETWVNVAIEVPRT